jgi:hypothetical protein
MTERLQFIWTPEQHLARAEQLERAAEDPKFNRSKCLEVARNHRNCAKMIAARQRAGVVVTFSGWPPFIASPPLSPHACDDANAARR